MSVKEVEFDSCGTRIRADLMLPEGTGPFPVVVMAGGWCYVKELRQPQYAQEFVDRGFAALIFDYRHMGASDGEPRQHIDPWAQVEDYQNAVTWAENQPELDASRIGAWGISYSGGHVLILASIDPRVKVIVSNVPVMDGYQTMWRVHGTERFRKLRDLITEDRRHRMATGEYMYMGMSGTPANPDAPMTTWPFDEVRVVFEELKATQAPRHEHRNTVLSVENLMKYDSSPYAARIINKPVMMIVAKDDDITMWDQEISAFDSIQSPDKELVILPATDHMTLYSNLTALDYAAKAAGSWFSRHLVENPNIENQIGRFA
jgi:putative CocE/NonD family hydrolase